MCCTCRVFIEHAVQAENGELSNLWNLFQQQQQHETFSCVNTRMFTAVRRNLGKVLLQSCFSSVFWGCLDWTPQHLSWPQGQHIDMFVLNKWIFFTILWIFPCRLSSCFFFLSLESFMLLHMSSCVIWDFWTNFPVRCGFFLVSFKITCCALGMISAGYSRLKKEEAALNFFHL